MTPTPTLPQHNVLRLAASQALMLSAIVMSMALGAIIGAQLAPDAGLATLPVAAMVVGVALASLPVGLLMRRTGAARARPLAIILRQPALLMSIFGAAVGYSAMIMAMTATPLAMLGCGLPGTSVTPVIQWHVVGMFAPSFFTGKLIQRHGAPRIMQIGFALLLGHVVIAVSGLEFLHFLSALVLLGLGWNFAFIGGTTLLTQTYRPAEQLRIQMVNEFIVFGLVAVASLSAGWLYARFGWVLLNLSMVPLLLVALLAASRMARSGQAVLTPA